MAVVFDQIIPAAGATASADSATKVALRENAGRVDLSTVYAFVGHHPFEIVGDVLPENITDITALPRTNEAGVFVNDNPVIAAAPLPVGLTITKSAVGDQDGYYTVTVPATGGPRMWTWVADVPVFPGGAPSINFRLRDRVWGFEVGIEFIDGPRRLNIVGANPGVYLPVVYDWMLETRYTIVINPYEQEVVWLRDGTILLWRVPYANLTVPILTDDLLEANFGNTGPNTTSLQVKEMQIHERPGQALVRGTISGQFGRSTLDRNMPVALHMAALNEQATAWDETVVGSAAIDAVDTTEMHLTNLLSRTDSRVDGQDFVLLMRATLEGEAAVPDEWEGATVQLSRAGQQVALNWFTTVTQQLGFLQLGGVHTASANHNLTSHDWRAESYYKLLGVGALANGLRLFVDQELAADISEVWANLPAVVATQLVVGVDLALSTVASTLKVKELVFFPGATIYLPEQGLPTVVGWTLDTGPAGVIAAGRLSLATATTVYDRAIADYPSVFSVGSVIEGRGILSSTAFMRFDDGGDALVLRAHEDVRGNRFVYVDRTTAGGELAMTAGLDAQETAAGARACQVDWTVDHTYRMEYHTDRGIRVFLDNDEEPVISIPLADADLPNTVDVDTVAFGGISNWQHVWFGVGDGYDISLRREFTEVDFTTAQGRAALLYVQGDNI